MINVIHIVVAKNDDRYFHVLYFLYAKLINKIRRGNKTENSNIFSTKNPIYTIKTIDNLIQNLKKYYESTNEKKIALLMKNFF